MASKLAKLIGSIAAHVVEKIEAAAEDVIEFVDDVKSEYEKAKKGNVAKTNAKTVGGDKQ